MTKNDWPVVKRMLRAGWPTAADGIDDDAYVGLLSSFETETVKESIRSLLASNRYMPRVSEIIAAIPSDDEPSPSNGVSPGYQRILREKAVRDRLADGALEADRVLQDSMTSEEWRVVYSKRVAAAATRLQALR